MGDLRLGAVRSGNPALNHSKAHFGRRMPSGANLMMAARFIRSGMAGLPQSRPIENDQSVVAMSPLTPAARARSMRSSMTSRDPVQYIWKNVFSFAAVTSSTDFDANELRPMIVPRLAAALATATSP